MTGSPHFDNAPDHLARCDDCGDITDRDQGVASFKTCGDCYKKLQAEANEELYQLYDEEEG